MSSCLRPFMIVRVCCRAREGFVESFFLADPDPILSGWSCVIFSGPCKFSQRMVRFGFFRDGNPFFRKIWIRDVFFQRIRPE